MARLWTCGFELNSTTADMEYTSSIGLSGVIDGSLRSGRYGFAAINASSAGSDNAGIRYTFASSAADKHIYVRMCVAFNTNTATGTPKILSLDDGTTERMSIRLNSNNTLQLWNASAQVGSDSPALEMAKWYRIELKYDSTHSAGSDVLDVRINGVSFASSSSQSLGTVSRLNMGGITLASSGSALYAIDDIALNDNSGSFQNSYPEEGKIVHLRPNAAGDNSDWTNDYQNVDETTPNDSTDIVSSNISNQIDDHNIDSPYQTGFDIGDISLVHVGVRFNGAGASANASFVLRIKAAASGTVEESSAITPSNTTWVTNAAAAPRNYALVLYDLPGASTTAWTKADLDTAQIGYRLSSTSTNAAQISAVWLGVEYTGAPAKRWGVKPR